MQFEYEITADQFVAAQVLYHKLTNGRKRRESALQWLLAAIILIAVAWVERCPNWTPFVLTLIAIWWIYVALVSLFPARHLRRAYSKSDMAGKKFKAELRLIGKTAYWRSSYYPLNGR